MKTNIKNNLNNLHLSDIYSLMFFVLYKIQDVPEYATLSEMCYLLDGNNLTRLLAYFGGKTITIPTEEEFVILCSALLLYQHINIDGMSFINAQNEIKDVTAKQRDEITQLYLKLIPIMGKYNIDRSQIQKYDR